MNKYNPNNKLRIYYDAEFTGLNRKTSLISIGLVSDSGTVFYAEFSDYDQNQVNEWIQKNVIQNLTMNDIDIEDNGDCYSDKMYLPSIINNDSVYNMKVKGDTNSIKAKLLEWLQNESTAAGKQIQIFTDCYAYDWVLMLDMICQYGDGINIPDYINYIPIDLSTLLWNIGVDPDINREEFVGPYNTIPLVVQAKHNSLWDAYVAKVCFEKIISNITVRFN